MRKGGAVRRKGLLTTRFDLVFDATGFGSCMLSPSSWWCEERRKERARRWWPASWWALTLAPKGHLAATPTPKCHPNTSDLNMLPLLVLLFQEVAAPSMFAWSHQPVIWNSKIRFGWTQDKAGSVLSQLHSHSALPSYYLQRPSSQLLRISAAHSAPACTSHSPLPCHWLQPTQISGLMYTTLSLVLVLIEGTTGNGGQF